MVTDTEPMACAGLVLAGGRSTRMGRDKAMLRWRGRPLIDHQIATLAAAGVDPVRVSGDRPGHAGMIDREPGAGPLGGLASSVAQLDDGLLLVVPVDMPRMSAALLDRLRQAPATTGCVRFAGHVLPMRLRLDVATREALVALMAATDTRSRSLRALQQRVGTTALKLQPDEEPQFIDCNTPEQWQEVNS